jgi:molybdopterin-guanine dinucleotide biosynthesis protein A
MQRISYCAGEGKENGRTCMKLFVVILAGGRSVRMGGRDKALAELGGARLIDHVIARLAPQVDRIAISGRQDYGTGFDVIADEPQGPQGPAAGVFAAARWMSFHQPDTDRFFTSPVDGPFLPEDLVARLGGADDSAIAVDDDGAHPTFACWTASSLAVAGEKLGGEKSLSLRALAAAAKAREIAWPGRRYFININTPEDLEAALRQREPGSPSR